MKKIILSIFLLSGILTVAQSEDPKNTNVLYLDAGVNVGANAGLAYEFSHNSDSKESLSSKYKTSSIIKLHYISTTLESNSHLVHDVDGTGFGLEVGSKTFFNKNEHKGFYAASYASYGSIKFSESNILRVPVSGVDGEFDGKYSYLSLFSPELGYKLLISNKIAIDFHVGTSWLIEFKGKGDIDNKSFDNWVLKAGVAIGYNF